MNTEAASISFGSLFALFSVLTGLIGVVSVGKSGKRWLSVGLFSQGVVLFFIAAAGRFDHAVSMSLCALVAAALLIIQTLFAATFLTENKDCEDVVE